MLGPSFRIALGLLGSLGACTFVFNEAQPGDGGSTSEEIDADPNACATGTPLIELIEIDELPCGDTEIRFPTVSVMPSSPQCPVERLRWTMSKRNADGSSADALLSVAGTPDTPMTPEARVLGGSFEKPVFNVANYHGPKLLKIDFTSAGTGYNQVFQDIQPVANETLVFRGAVLAGSGSRLSVSLFDGQSGNGTPVLGLGGLCLGTMGEFCEAPTELTTFVHSFSTGQLNSTPRLRFTLGSPDEYYFDNVTLTRESGGTNLVADSSFDESLVASNVWTIMCPDGGVCPSETIDIPDILAEYGVYRITLVAIDINNVQSEPVSWDFNHQACPPP